MPATPAALPRAGPDPSLRDRLSQAQAAQIERLQCEMRALVQKLASEQRWEVSRDEWVAYERATEKFVGGGPRRVAALNHLTDGRLCVKTTAFLINSAPWLWS